MLNTSKLRLTDNPFVFSISILRIFHVLLPISERELFPLTTLNNQGRKVDVVLGFDSIQGYLEASEKYHGATIGRYANRISQGQISIKDKVYFLPKNAGEDLLHGGTDGYHEKVWKCVDHDESSIVLQLYSPHMEGGFPGDLTTRVKYSIEGSILRIEYTAVTTEETYINLTHHSFFNLNGEGSGSILNHSLRLNAEYYLPVNQNLIPTGSIDMVSDTAFDFYKVKKIGDRIGDEHPQLILAKGYDHNYVVHQYAPGVLNFVAVACGDLSGVEMEVWSTEPGVQFYTGNHLNGADLGKTGVKYGENSAFCLETQHFPDSPNQKHFPSTLLMPNDTFHSTTEYRFSIHTESFS